MIRPLIVLPDAPAFKLSPFENPLKAPFISIARAPSIETGWLIGGNPGEPGWIVWTPGPGMLKQITSRPGLEFANMIAARSEPEPGAELSVVVVTVTEHAALVPTAQTTVRRKSRARGNKGFRFMFYVLNKGRIYERRTPD